MSETPEDYDEQAERLKQQAADAKQEADAQHDALLEAAANDEELVVEETDTTTIGDAELTVKTTVPGEVLRQFDGVAQGDQTPTDQLDAVIDALTSQTESITAEDVTLEDDPDIRAFFEQFIDNHDVKSASTLCLKRVIEEPADLERERREDITQSFPGARQSRAANRGAGERGP